MTTLAEHIIVAGAENRPPMLEKSMYDSWTSRIRLFIKGKKRGRVMLDSIDNGSLVYPTGETLYEYYWRFSQLINDMHTIGMTIKQVQVNTKFLNALPSEWNMFVTHVKLAKSLYTTNYDQLYAYLSQHERHANEVRITRERYPDPLALVANSPTLYNPSQSPQHSGSSMYPPPQQFTPVYATPIHHQYHHTPVNPQQHLVSPQPFISPSVTQHSQADFPQLDSGLAVPTFQQGEDPIECINKAMAFLSAMASRFPPSNNQLRTSSNPRNQATIQDGRVTVQQVQGRQSQSFAGTGNRGIATTSRGNYAAGQPRVVKYNPLEFSFEDLDAYESDCDDLSSVKAVLMENLSSWDSDVLSEVPYFDSSPNDMINQNVQEMQYSEQTHIDDFQDNKIHSDSNIILYSQYLQESQDAAIQDTNSAPNDLLVLFLVEQMTDHAQRIQPTLYDGGVIAKEHAVISVIDDEETLILEEESRSKMLDKQNDPISIEKKIKISPIDY
ncbi:hypothetical protein Tco_0663949 [Tanacetum coccineum]